MEESNPKKKKKGYRPVFWGRRVKRGRWAGPFESEVYPLKDEAKRAWKKEIKPAFKEETGYKFFKIKYIRVGIKKPKKKPKKKKIKKPVKKPKKKPKKKKAPKPKPRETIEDYLVRLEGRENSKWKRSKIKKVLSEYTPEKITSEQLDLLSEKSGWRRKSVKKIAKKLSIRVVKTKKKKMKYPQIYDPSEKIAVGMEVKILRGKHKGKTGEVVDFSIEDDQVDVKLPDDKEIYLDVEDVRVIGVSEEKKLKKKKEKVTVKKKKRPKRIYIDGIKGGYDCPDRPDRRIAKDWKTMRGWMDLTGLKPPKGALKFYKEQGIKDAVTSVKADGELTVLHFDEKGVKVEGLMEPPRLGKYLKIKRNSALVNAHHTIRIDNYITESFTKLMKKKGIKKIRLVGELYATYEDGKPMSFGDIANSLDSDDWGRSKEEWMFWAFDLHMLDGEELFETMTYKNRLKKIRKILKDGVRNIVPVPAMFGPPVPSIKKMWREWVLNKQYEGLVITEQKGDFFRVAKVKTQFTVDATIIGFDHSGALYKNKGIPNAFLLALMDRKGKLVGLGKMSGGHKGSFGEDIKLQWKKRLIKDKFSKDDRWVYVKPRHVVEVKFLEISTSRLRPPGEVKVYKIRKNKTFAEVGTRPGYVPRSGMKFVRWRKDKGVNKQDIRLSQVAEYVGETMRGRALKKLAKSNPMFGWRRIPTEKDLGE